MIAKELAQKLNFVVTKFQEVMPRQDFPTFQALIKSYIDTGRFTTSRNQNVNNLAQAVIQSMATEKVPTTSGGVVKVGRYRGYGRGWWYQPYWWNYWYPTWSTYYWWPYSGYGYIGGSKGSHSDIMGNVLDQSVDVKSINMACDDATRECELNMRFIKAPVSWMDQTAIDLDTDIFNQQ